MVHPNGHKTVIEYSGVNICDISIDGFHLKSVSKLDVHDLSLIHI